MIGFVGTAAWWWFKMVDGRARKQYTRSAQVTLPTDTMGAGTGIPAIQGIIKEGNGLSFIGE